jgi:hypothetical protein
MSQQLQPPVGAMSVNAFAIWAGIGRTTAWNEIRRQSTGSQGQRPHNR